MRTEIVRSTSGRYCWRLWNRGQMIADGSVSTEERGELAAAVAEARWIQRQELHLYGGGDFDLEAELLQLRMEME